MKNRTMLSGVLAFALVAGVPAISGAAQQSTMDKVQQIESQLFVKHQELRALQNAQQPDAKAVGEKAQEIAKLNDELYAIQKNMPQPDTSNETYYHHGGHGGHGGHCCWRH